MTETDFINDEDYKVVIGDTALKVVSQTDAAVRANAEREAVEEIAAYLRPKYDCEAAFTAAGGERNPQLVMYACDVALYHMVSAMPQKMGSEVRRERYERALKWLEGVQAGRIIPDIPLMGDKEGGEDTAAGSAIRYGSQTKLNHNW